MGGWGWFFLILLFIVLAYAAWAGWHFYNAKRQGLPPPPAKSYIPFLGAKSTTQAGDGFPTPRSSNPVEWIKDQMSKLRGGNRTHQGAYEETGNAEAGSYAGLQTGVAGGRRGRGVEDDAWDTRVGNEDPYGHGAGGYYEEQELGLAPTPGYANESQDKHSDYMHQATSYGGGQRGPAGGENPFGDHHELPEGSMRSISPRPAERSAPKSHHRDAGSIGSRGSSPTSVRKSHFREGI